MNKAMVKYKKALLLITMIPSKERVKLVYEPLTKCAKTTNKLLVFQ